MIKNLGLRTNITLGLIFAFLVNTFGPLPLAQAQSALPVAGDFRLPAPGVMVHLSPEFNPPILKGIKVHPDNPFRFDFILDQGDSPPLVGEKSYSLPLAGRVREGDLKQESTRLIKYFLASLTIPEKDLWVNLSPYEKDRIIPNSFGQTEMGRDLLAEDYMLKQITASLIYPEDEIGKKFWKRIYEEAAKKFGTTNIPVNTFNKVWIVPEKAVVYENAKAGTAYVVESKLKVMLEQDYLALSKNSPPLVGEKTYSLPLVGRVREGDKGDVNALGSQIVRASPATSELSEKNRDSSLASNILRAIVIPELTKEINEDKNFAKLRQVYNSLILATWYKKKIKDSILAQVYADKNKVAGVNIDDPQEKEKIYQQYLKAFKKGVYNYIKEDYDPATQQTIPRKYFSGGVNETNLRFLLRTIPTIDPAQLNQSNLEVVSSRFDSAMLINESFTGTGDDAQLTEHGIANEDKNLFYILTAPDGIELAAKWIQTYANENRTEGREDIDRILEFLSDPHNRTGNYISDVLKRFPILEDMHRRFAQATQPSKKIQPFDLPAVKGKTELFGSLINGPNLLDVGAGTGIFSERCLNIYPKIFHAISVDIESQRQVPFQIPAGKTHEFKLMKDPSVIPVQDRWANTVVATFALHHVEVDRLHYLEEIRRTMIPGGRFIVLEDTFSNVVPENPFDKNDLRAQQLSTTFHSLRSDKERLSFLHFADWFIHNFVNRSRAPLIPGHYETMEGWSDIFKKAGFIVEQERSLGFSALGSRNPESRGFFILKNPSNEEEKMDRTQVVKNQLNGVVDRAMKGEEKKTRDSTQLGINKLLVKATDNFNPKGIFGSSGAAGISEFLGHSRRPYKWLLTKYITAEDLPADYPVALREPDFTKSPPGYINVNLPGTDVILGSHVHNGSRGVVRLGWLNDGTPVAIKARYTKFIDNDNKLISSDYYEALTLDRLGIGPRLHGLFKDEFGRISIVMDIVPGDMLEQAKEFVTPVTVADLGEINRRLGGSGKSMGFDMNYFITPAGRILLIDPEKINLTRPDSDNKAYIKQLSWLLQIANPEVQKQSLLNLSIEDPLLLRALRKSVDISIQFYEAINRGDRPKQRVALLEAIDSVLGNLDDKLPTDANLAAAGVKAFQKMVMKSDHGGRKIEKKIWELAPNLVIVHMPDNPKFLKNLKKIADKFTNQISLNSLAFPWLRVFNRAISVQSAGGEFTPQFDGNAVFVGGNLVACLAKAVADFSRKSFQSGKKQAIAYLLASHIWINSDDTFEDFLRNIEAKGKSERKEYIAKFFNRLILDSRKGLEYFLDPQFLDSTTIKIRVYGLEEVEFKRGGDHELIIDIVRADDRRLSDKAALSKEETGGIDLTPSKMNLQTQNAGEGIKFHLDPAMLQQLQNAPGFVPVIINIQPLKSLQEFLGLNQSQTNTQLGSQAGHSSLFVAAT